LPDRVCCNRDPLFPAALDGLSSRARDAASYRVMRPGDGVEIITRSAARMFRLLSSRKQADAEANLAGVFVAMVRCPRLDWLSAIIHGTATRFS